jgi:hypothetical protein
MITPDQLAGSSEDSQCKALLCWCVLNIKQYPQLKWFTHIPNGGARDIREGAKFKAMGVKPGFPDYFLPVIKASKYNGLMIEMKIEKYRNTKNGGLSQEQVDWMLHLIHAGYRHSICYSWEEARDVIVGYLNG